MSRIPVSTNGKIGIEARKRKKADRRLSRQALNTADVNEIISQYLIDNPINMINSIQRGSTTILSNTTTNVPISTVDFTKSVVNISFSNGVVGNIGTSNDSMHSFSAGGRLTTATNLEIASGKRLTTTNQESARVYWEVIEYV